MNIIFLDIDGVLNSTNYMVYCDQNNIPFHPNNQMDPATVARLNHLTDATQAKLVVSSTWRLSFHKMPDALERLQDCLRGYGITGEIIGFTPSAWDLTLIPQYGEQRGAEIQAWLEENPNIEKFVILDDSADMGKLLPHLVRTSTEIGLTDIEVTKIKEILK